MPTLVIYFKRRFNI